MEPHVYYDRSYVPPPTGVPLKVAWLEADIADLKKCLAGDGSSKRWKILNVELANKEGELLHMKRRLAGRTPQMESWADPLPG